jgi:PKD domain
MRWKAALAACAVSLLLTAQAFGRTLDGVVPDGHARAADRISHAHIAAFDVPTTPSNLPYGGGPVLHRNRTHVIFWQPTGSKLAFDPGYQAPIVTFLRNVAAASHAASNVYGLTGQYADARGAAAYSSVYGGAVTATDPLPANGCSEPSTGPGWSVCLTDRQLQREIEHVVRADRLPHGANDVYFLVTPDGLGDCADSAGTSCALGGDAAGYCAYHQQTDDGEVLYAVIPYNAIRGHCQSDNPRPNGSTADPALSTISHEHSEMITDPIGNAWIDPSSGNEDGDLCLTSFGPNLGGSGGGAWNEVINGGHYYLQEEWSNADHGCQPRAKADSVSFTGPSGRGLSLSFVAKASTRHGVIVSYQWFFGDRHTGRGRRVTHRYAKRGTYRVVLRTTDSWGNWSFAARVIKG